MIKKILKVVVSLLVVLAVMLLVSSPVPLAGAEILDAVPQYQPVELAATEVEPLPMDQSAPYEPHAGGFSADGKSYLDDTISVRVQEFRQFDTNIQVTWVQIADPTQLRSATAAKWPSKKTINADRIAKREKAVLAINGDYIVYMNTGFSARNGKILRSREGDKDAGNFDLLMIDDKGDFTIIQKMNKQKVADYLESHTLLQAFTFGPGLVVNGEKFDKDPVSSHSPTHHTQRMAIGQVGPLSYVIVTTEGPDDKNSEGLTLDQLADVFVELGVNNAYNLDGGSSSWLVLNYKRINGMHGSKHRDIADIIYFVTAQPDGGDL